MFLLSCFSKYVDCASGPLNVTLASLVTFPLSATPMQSKLLCRVGVQQLPVFFSFHLGLAGLLILSIKMFFSQLVAALCLQVEKGDRHLRSRCEEFPMYQNIFNCNRFCRHFFSSLIPGSADTEFRGNYSKSNCGRSLWGCFKIPLVHVPFPLLPSLLTLELPHLAAAFFLTIRHSWKMFASTLDNFQFILAGNEDLLPHLGYLLLGLFTNKHDKCFSLWSVLI